MLVIINALVSPGEDAEHAAYSLVSGARANDLVVRDGDVLIIDDRNTASGRVILVAEGSFENIHGLLEDATNDNHRVVGRPEWHSAVRLGPSA